MAELGVAPLLGRRLIFVLGKGGVGRTTVAAALGLLAARRGARVIVAELSARGEIPALFGAPAKDGEVEVAPGLWTIQVDPRRALDEYLHSHLPLRMLADLVGVTRLIGYVAAATPGLRELLSAGKVWELAEAERRLPDSAPYDLVIVDAPASGHALALLSAPRALAKGAQSGPIARQGGRIDAALRDPSHTALLAVARPADAEVTELLELRDALAEHVELTLDLVAVNAAPPPAVDERDIAALRAALVSNGALVGDARAAVERTLAENEAAKAGAAQVSRLERALRGVALIELPALYSTGFGPAEVEALSERLEQML